MKSLLKINAISYIIHFCTIKDNVKINKNKLRCKYNVIEGILVYGLICLVDLLMKISD